GLKTGKQGGTHIGIPLEDLVKPLAGNVVVQMVNPEGGGGVQSPAFPADLEPEIGLAAPLGSQRRISVIEESVQRLVDVVTIPLQVSRSTPAFAEPDAAAESVRQHLLHSGSDHVTHIEGLQTLHAGIFRHVYGP